MGQEESLDNTIGIDSDFIEPNYKIENVVATVVVEIVEPEVRIDLTKILGKVENTEYNPERFPGLVMRIKEPKGTLLVFSTGKFVVTGLRSASEAPSVVKKAIKNISKAGIKVLNPKITIQNIVASGDLHINIDLNTAAIVMENSMYEPEVFPGLIYRMQEPKTVFLLFSTGKVVCTGAKTKEIVEEAFLKLNRTVRELNVSQKHFSEKEYDELGFI